MIENGETCSSITDNPDQLISSVSAQLPPNSSEHYNISTSKQWILPLDQYSDSFYNRAELTGDIG